MQNLLLFIIPALIWGSTWLAIKFQLGEVDPLISIFYRFLAAGLLLMGFSRLRRHNLKYSLHEHGLMALLGTLLFGINYWLVYLAELHLASGLVAVVFSTIVFLNIFNSALFLKAPVRRRVVTGAFTGFAGIALLFRSEIFDFSFSSNNSLAFLIALLGAATASLGNITSAYIQKRRIPVVQANAFGMMYGAVLMLILALLTGKSVTFQANLPYIASLLYLVIFGSAIAFGSYLTLLGRVGADKAGYIALVIPVIALILSTVFEGYRWDLVSLLGVALILFGNGLILRKRTLNRHKVFNGLEQDGAM